MNPPEMIAKGTDLRWFLRTKWGLARFNTAEKGDEPTAVTDSQLAAIVSMLPVLAPVLAHRL